MGFGAFLSALIWGGAAIDAAIDNHKMMSEPARYLEDGTPVYLDRHCNQHINGEKVITKWTHDSNGDVKLIEVGEKSGRIYNDPEENLRRRMEKRNEDDRLDARTRGWATYEKYDMGTGKKYTCEVSTNRPLALLICEKDKTCWKYYLPEREKGNIFYNPKEDINNTPIQISVKEFNELNKLGGTFYSEIRAETYGYGSRQVKE